MRPSIGIRVVLHIVSWYESNVVIVTTYEHLGKSSGKRKKG